VQPIDVLERCRTKAAAVGKYFVRRQSVPKEHGRWPRVECKNFVAPYDHAVELAHFGVVISHEVVLCFETVEQLLFLHVKQETPHATLAQIFQVDAHRAQGDFVFCLQSAPEEVVVLVELQGVRHDAKLSAQRLHQSIELQERAMVVHVVVRDNSVSHFWEEVRGSQ